VVSGFAVSGKRRGRNSIVNRVEKKMKAQEVGSRPMCQEHVSATVCE
jgi:hypothetical protein